MPLCWVIPLHWPRAKGKRPRAPKPTLSSTSSSVSMASVLCITIINACMVITTTATILAIALGSLATMPTMTMAQHPTSNIPTTMLHSHDSQNNYQGVADTDTVSAVTGLSNGYAMPDYMENYYELYGRNEGANVREQKHQHQQQQQYQEQQQYHQERQQQQQQQQRHHQQIQEKQKHQQQLQQHQQHYNTQYLQHNQHPLQPLNMQLYDKESSGATIGHQYSNSKGEGGPLEVYKMAESGFIPTSLTAAGQHYAAHKKNNQRPTTAIASAAGHGNVEQSDEIATSYANMVTAFNDNTRLHGRLSNYEAEAEDENENENGHSNRGESVGDRGNTHRPREDYELAYDNYVANMYNVEKTKANNEEQEQEREQEQQGEVDHKQQQQNFPNYFTTTNSQQHNYVPRLNYHVQFLEPEEETVQHRQQLQQHPKEEQSSQAFIQSRSSKIPQMQSLSTSPSNPFYDFYKPSNNYQTWNVMEQYPQRFYYSKNNEEGETSKEDPNHNRNEPETAETSYVLHFNGKKGKTKSKRSSAYDTYMNSPSGQHEHTNYEVEEEQEQQHSPSPIEYQRQQLQELQQQLQQQHHHFLTLQHQLINHDQQLQNQKQQGQYTPALPPVTTIVRHTPQSLQALASKPLAKHTHVVRQVPVPERKQVFIPQSQPVAVPVPDTIIATIPQPTPIHIPISKTVAIPDVKEVKIPIEKVNPYPVERAIPYIVEKRVPYPVEKQVAKPYYYSVPIKVPIVHTIVHKVHTVHPKHYPTTNHIVKTPINYKGHIRHIHHHGQNHYGGQYTYK